MIKKSIVDLKDIRMSFDGEVVLDGINLSIKDGEFVTLLGPSGCGKTTTLRIIAGFASPDSGDVFLRAKDQFPACLQKKYQHYLSEVCSVSASECL